MSNRVFNVLQLHSGLPPVTGDKTSQVGTATETKAEAHLRRVDHGQHSADTIEKRSGQCMVHKGTDPRVLPSELLIMEVSPHVGTVCACVSARLCLSALERFFPPSSFVLCFFT